jgi:uncharacterized protein YcgI (DUF1989 family)
MDVIVAVSTAPHPLDPAAGLRPGMVGVTAWRSGPAPADDCLPPSAPKADGPCNWPTCMYLA